jgi:hypothetical protein
LFWKHCIEKYTRLIPSNQNFNTKQNNVMPIALMGHAVVKWLRHYTASQKVAGSRPDGCE